MAYMLAQQRLQRARLNRDDAGNPDGRYTLATSAQPCCQCYGATIWAGIDRLLIGRSEEHTSELQSLMRISYAVFCLKKTTINSYRFSSNREHGKAHAEDQTSIKTR